MYTAPPGYSGFASDPIGGASTMTERGSAPGATAFPASREVDLFFWQRVIDAGQGPVTGIPAITPQVQAMRSLEVCPYKFRL